MLEGAAICVFTHGLVLGLRRMSAMRAAIAEWPWVGQCLVRAVPVGPSDLSKFDAAPHPRSAVSPQ